VSGRGLLSEIARPNFLHVAFGLGLSSSSCVAIRYVCEYNLCVIYTVLFKVFIFFLKMFCCCLFVINYYPHKR